MSILSSGILALGLSADAFAVSLGKGAYLEKPKIQEALRIGLVFGLVEAIAPMLGWLLGTLTNSYVEHVDHWVAFTILGVIGFKFIYESFQPQDEKGDDNSHSLGVLLLAALATSIDSFAIGISLAFMRYNIFFAAASIGIATFSMVTIGIMCGRYARKRIGRYAERLGGAVLILIGLNILIDHLTSM